MARRNPSSDAALWIALGVGVVGVGVGVYFLASRGSSSSQSSQQLPPSSPVTLFEQGKTYQFTAALPPGMPIDPAAVAQALEAFGWTNVTISSITPGTYTATATCSSCAPAMPPGTTATLV